jgi:hypothetical protein
VLVFPAEEPATDARKLMPEALETPEIQALRTR